MTDLSSLLAQHEVIDLSIALDEELPCSWPRHEQFRHTPTNWFAPVDALPGRWDRLGSYYTASVHLDEHTGTHVDAPVHHIPPPDSGLRGAAVQGAVTADRIPLPQLMGAAHVLDVRDLVDTTPPGISPRVGVDVLERHERDHGRVGAGDVVLLRSDWDLHCVPGEAGARYASAPLAGAAPGWPAPADELMEVLLERGVRTVGTDSPSMGATDEGVGAHRIGLGGGMVFIEAMASLAALPPVGATVLFLGLRIVDGSGAPGRAVAFVPRG